MKILHLSDTTLSGSPYRLSQLYNKYSGHEARHIVWLRTIFNRTFQCDMVGSEMSQDERQYWLDWADVIHYHNRWRRQEIFKFHKVPNKPSVIQIHSPRQSKIEDDFKDEVNSGIPLAIIAQYHPRQWPEKKFIIPNVVDIYSPDHMPIQKQYRNVPMITYAPSNCNCRGWDDKSYSLVNSTLRRMAIRQKVYYTRITGMPHNECLMLKQESNIGVDEVATGSYHMSTLEYLSMGVATIVYTDEQTEKVVKDLTGCDSFPWVHNGIRNFEGPLNRLINLKQYEEIGRKSRLWMEKFWAPDVLCEHFNNMYNNL